MSKKNDRIFKLFSKKDTSLNIHKTISSIKSLSLWLLDFFLSGVAPYWIEDVSVTLVIDEDDACTTGVGEDLADAGHVAMLCHILPVLNEEEVNVPMLKCRHSSPLKICP